MDPHLITVIGTVLVQAAGVYVAWFGIAKRSWLFQIVRDRNSLVRDLGVAKNEGADHLRRAINAEALSNTLESRVSIMQDQIKELTDSVHMLQPLKQQVDLIYDWTHKLIDYAMELEDVLRRNKLDLGGKTMPVVPPELATRFGVPEALQ